MQAKITKNEIQMKDKVDRLGGEEQGNNKKDKYSEV
jgi:hypothetical protein